MDWRAGLSATFGRRLALVVAAAAALRVAYAVGLAPGVQDLGDDSYFSVLADLIARGAGWVDPFKAVFRLVSVPTAAHPPLYPLLLAGVVKVFGSSLFAKQLVGLVAGSATVLACGLLGRRLGGEGAGLAAAGIAAVYPVFIASDGAIMSESLYGLIVALGLLAALRLLKRPSTLNAALTGFAVGAAALVRAEALGFLVLLLPLVLTRLRGRRLPCLAALLACALLTISPWTVRNLTTFHRPVLISTNDGRTLSGSNCAATYRGRELGYFDLRCIAPPRTGAEKRNEAVYAARLRRNGLRYAANHADRLPLVVTIRVLRLWGLWQPNRQWTELEGRSLRVQEVGIGAYYLLALLAAVGVTLLARRRAELMVVLSPFLLVTLVAAWSNGHPRFREAAEIPIVVLAALGGQRIWRRLRPKLRSGGGQPVPAREAAQEHPPAVTNATS